MECKNCGTILIDEGAPPRYDLLNPAFNSETSTLTSFGPYCVDCWPTTITGATMTLTAKEEADRLKQANWRSIANELKLQMPVVRDLAQTTTNGEVRRLARNQVRIIRLLIKSIDATD